MNRKVKKVLGYGLVSLMLCGPALVSKVDAEETSQIQTTAQFKIIKMVVSQLLVRQHQILD